MVKFYDEIIGREIKIRKLSFPLTNKESKLEVNFIEYGRGFVNIRRDLIPF